MYYYCVPHAPPIPPPDKINYACTSSFPDKSVSNFEYCLSRKINRYRNERKNVGGRGYLPNYYPRLFGLHMNYCHGQGTICTSVYVWL